METHSALMSSFTDTAPSRSFLFPSYRGACTMSNSCHVQEEVVETYDKQRYA